jgi:hypothetical protein
MTRFARFLTAFLLTACLLAAAGCIRSRIVVESEPSGAAVKFDNQDYGDTPVTIPFIWYWYHDVEVSKEGFEPSKASEYLATPPWFLFPLDLFAEAIPVPFYDTRHFKYTLKPAPKSDVTAPAAEATPVPATPTVTVPAPPPTALP